MLSLSGYKKHIEFMTQWGDLATYNSEVARGILHTQEKKAEMEQKQREYDIWIRKQIG